MNLPDVKQVRRDSRREWVKARRSTPDKIGGSVHWWLVVVALAFYALSYPHTRSMFVLLAGSWGEMAPWGIEFGILFVAFRRKQDKIRDEAFPIFLQWFQRFLFGVAMLVNGAGSLIMVVQSSVVTSATSNIEKMSLGDLLSQWPSMPATSQVAMVLALLSAIIIPVGTYVAGEGLATLFLTGSKRDKLLEDQWAIDGPRVEFLALRDACLNVTGWSPAKAERWAARIAGYRVDTVPRPTVMDTSGRSVDSKQAEDRTRSGRPSGRNPNAKADTRQFIADNRDAIDWPVRRVEKEMAGQGLYAGKSTIGTVQNEMRAKGFRANGHGEFVSIGDGDGL